MRWLLVAASLLVLIIGAPLFLLPTTSDTLFSWTVNPPLTAAFLGAGYMSSFLLEYLSSRERIWARARVAVPSVLIFTTVMFLVTLAHLDKFHLGSDFSTLTQAITWVWLLVYGAVPVIMAVLAIVQIRSPGVDPPRLSPVPRAMFFVLIAQAVVLLSLGMALLIAPVSVGSEVWPWSLSALTARAIGAFLLGTGVVAAHSVWENDLLRLAGAMAAYCSFGLLELLALARFAGADHPATGEPVLDWNDPRTWAYVAFFFSLAVVGLWGWLGVQAAKRSVSESAQPQG